MEFRQKIFACSAFCNRHLHSKQERILTILLQPDNYGIFFETYRLTLRIPFVSLRTAGREMRRRGAPLPEKRKYRVEHIMCSFDTIDIAVLSAVPAEIKDLSHFPEDRREIPFLGETLWTGNHGNLRLLFGTTGFGKVNAAIVTAALLKHFPIREVWHIGCAGAYSEGTLSVGDVLISEEVLCGDEGILMESGILPTREIGIPILVRKEQKYYDHVPVDTSLIHRIRDKTPAGYYRLIDRSGSAEARRITDGKQNGDGAFQVAFGLGLTVSMVSGDTETAGKRFRQYGALAENMEGSAVAQACFRFGVPMLECRGISNVAGDRCKARWHMETAIAHCQGIVTTWLGTAVNSEQ